jgi:hypothetical protein
VQVISRIKQAFTVEMLLSVLFAAPTVARMAEHIAAVNGPDRSQSSPVLVNIQPHGSWPPFFCVHAIGGQVIGYAELSQGLGLEQPFYGLQSPPVILGHMRRHLQIPALGHKIPGVIALASGHRHSLLSRNLLQHG